jgi:hypothetical protein
MTHQFPIATPIALYAMILAALATVTLPRPVSGQTRKPLFIADQEACFGRVYDRAHLASHPSQKVTSVHIFRYLQQRSEAENWRPNDRQEAIDRFRRTGHA